VSSALNRTAQVFGCGLAALRLCLFAVLSVRIFARGADLSARGHSCPQQPGSSAAIENFNPPTNRELLRTGMSARRLGCGCAALRLCVDLRL